MRDEDETLDKLQSILAEAETIPHVDPKNPLPVEEIFKYTDLVGKAKALMWVLEIERGKKDAWI